MKHEVSIKDIRNLIADNDLNITARRSGTGVVEVYSHIAGEVIAFAVICRMRNIAIDLHQTGSGKWYGSISCRFKLVSA